jgi:hypothetical protein
MGSSCPVACPLVLLALCACSIEVSGLAGIDGAARDGGDRDADVPRLDAKPTRPSTRTGHALVLHVPERRYRDESSVMPSLGSSSIGEP